MRKITRITTQDELTREIADTEQEIERQKLNVKSNWMELKNDMKPANMVRGLFSRPSIPPSHNGVHTENKPGLPVMAAKMAAGLLLNRWMAKKSFGMTKMAAGMLVQTGLAAMITKWAAKKLQKKPVIDPVKKVA
jgi:hypothetical protein